MEFLLLKQLAISPLWLILLPLLSWFFLKTKAKSLPGVLTPNPWRPWFGNYFDIRQNFGRFPDYRLETAQIAIKAGSNKFQRSLCGKPVFLESLSPEINQYILKDGFENFEKGQVFRETFFDVLGRGIFASDGPTWQHTRKVASHMFATTVLRNKMERVFVDHGRDLCLLLEHRMKGPEKDQTIDMQNLFFRFTMDAICEIAFGRQLNSIQTEVPFAKSFDRAQELTIRRFMYPFQSWKLLKLFNAGIEKEMSQCVSTINQFVYDIIQARADELKAEQPASPESEEKGSADLLTLFIRSARKKGETLSQVELRDLVLNFMIAGRDTTACALSWMFWRLSKHPDVEAKLLAEIEHHVGDAEPTLDRVKEMDYADALFSEVVRLHPPVPSDSKTAARSCELPDGLAIPKGTVINYSPYVMGRLESIWGKDAHEFRPERWIELAQQTGKPIRTAVSQYSFVHFNAGPRLCLGKDMAYLEAKILTILLLQKFRFSTPPDFKPHYKTTIVLPMTELPMYVRRRN